MWLSYFQISLFWETQILEDISFPAVFLLDLENLRLINVLLDVDVVDDNDPLTSLGWPA